MNPSEWCLLLFCVNWGLFAIMMITESGRGDDNVDQN